MAASATPRPKPPRVDLIGRLAGLAPALPLAVAYSGGADSTALLLAAHATWPGCVQAIHVHHGLQSAADAFEAHCRQLCTSLAVPLHVARVDARHEPGQSPEDAARRARYAALARIATQERIPTVWLAQHADDQVETLLLALSRGAGLPGLSGMAVRFEGDLGVIFERPWLDVAGSALRAWLRKQGAAWIEDPTNTDPAYTRNRIRHQLLPAIEQAFPSFRETFARSMRHAAQARQVLDELAVRDLASMDGEPRIAALQRLPRERQANVLRHWLRQRHAASASTAQLDEALDQIDACRTRGHDLRLRVGHGLLQRQGERLTYTSTV